jgi:predicted O-methyltransferase YrrM
MGQIAADAGALVRVLALASGARRLLEIGTGHGESGICLTGALPPGCTLLTLEGDAHAAGVARANFARHGLADRINVVVGNPALLVNKVSGPFDLILQDGRSPLPATRLETLVGLLRPSGLFITYNAQDANELHTHPAFITAHVPLSGDVAISVKHP